MPAPVTIAGALSLMFTVGKSDQTYAVMENALIAAGFSDFVISRQSYDTTMDVTITIYQQRTPLTGTAIPLPAKDSLTKLAAAVGKFGD